MITKYRIGVLPNGDWLLQNDSPMYPSVFEEKINKLAEYKISKTGPEISFMSGFVNSFSISKEFLDIFKKKVLPNIGYELAPYLVVWDRDEENAANLI